MRDINDFGLFIINKRKQAGLTQESLAKKLGVTPQAVSKWENGIGYPDITLFPDISKMLNVSISELFGEPAEAKEPTIPETYKKGAFAVLPLVYRKGNTFCYSSKYIKDIDEKTDTVFFNDGSYAELMTGLVYNKGTGEISIVDAELLREEKKVRSARSNVCKQLEDFHSLFLELKSVNAKVNVQLGDSFYAEAAGSEFFLRTLKFTRANGTLSVTAENSLSNEEKDVVNIYMPTKSGKKLTLAANGNFAFFSDIDFEDVVLKSRGNSSISGRSCERLELSSNGNSSFDFRSVREQGKIDIHGNASCSIHSLRNGELHINGNSSVALSDISGDLAVYVNGNSGMELSGECGRFVCELDGNGEVDGGGLTVNTAEVTIKKKGRVSVERVKDHSIERVGGKGVFLVEKRG